MHANCSCSRQLPFPSNKSGSHIHAFLFDPLSLTKAICVTIGSWLPLPPPSTVYTTKDNDASSPRIFQEPILQHGGAGPYYSHSELGRD